MSTRRVPGITRNSGWQAVDAEIVEARGRRQHQAAPAKIEPGAAGGVRQLGEVSQG